MRRRALLLPLLLAACGGLSERPYVERRTWPLTVARPGPLPPRPRGKVLEVRMLRAGPGLEGRSLLTLRPDGSMFSDFYEQWISPPAEAVEDALRRWLAASGLFAGVVAPGTRALPDFALEGELTALWSEPADRRARAALSINLIGQRGATPRVILQRRFTAEAPLRDDSAAAAVQAQTAALADVLGQVEAALRAVPGLR